LTAIPDSFDLLDNLLWRSNDGGGNNVWGVDFTMHSTYEDALSGLNPWECPNNAYNYGDGFPGNCSPDGTQVKNQQSRFNSGNDQKDVAWYVNKPEASPHLQLAPSTTIQGRQYGGGSAVLAEDGTIYLTGSGEDIWGWNDDFNYYSEPFEGDHTVIVHVSSQSAPWFHEWSKAGIMVRGSMDSNSPHASVFLTGSRGICTMMRSGAFNGNPDDKRSESLGCVMEGAQSAWLKLEKRMDTYTSFVGEDDGSGTISWTKLHSFDVPLIGDDYNVGLAACSIRWIPMEVVFEDYQVQSYFFPSAAPSVSSAPLAYGKLNRSYIGSYCLGGFGKLIGSCLLNFSGLHGHWKRWYCWQHI
jgi:regulation of enolase protein 1 (concanavalin A-like superfamily)